jgi:hypothetical protein
VTRYDLYFAKALDLFKVSNIIGDQQSVLTFAVRAISTSRIMRLDSSAEIFGVLPLFCSLPATLKRIQNLSGNKPIFPVRNKQYAVSLVISALSFYFSNSLFIFCTNREFVQNNSRHPKSSRID